MILDTFYFLFKTDSKEAQRGVDELDKKIESLTAKGKKRSDAESKDLKESLKQRKELNQSLKETENQYTKITESLVQLGVAAITSAAITRGIFSAAETNSALQIQGKLLGQSVVDIKAYGQAVKSLGGSSEAFGSYFQKIFEEYSEAGLPLESVENIIKRQRELLKTAQGAPGSATLAANQQRLFGQIGATDPGHKLLLIESDEEFNKRIERNKKLTKNTEEGAETARKFGESWSEVENSLNSVFTSVGNDVLPAFEGFNKITVKFLNFLNEHRGIAETFFAELTLGTAALSGALTGGLIPALGTLGSVAGFAFKALIPILLVAKGGSELFTAINHNEFFHAQAGKLFNPIINAFGGKAQRKKEIPLSAEEYIPEGDKLFDTSKPTKSELAYQKLQNAQNSLSSATSIGSYTNSYISGGKAVNVKTGDIHVHTNAENAHGIAGDISGELSRQIQSAISNLDDGVNY